MPNIILNHRYQIISKLGKGGFGTTYLAVDLHLPNHPQCVVKQLTPPLDPHPQVFQFALTLFDKEAKILKQLGKHEQIPELFAYFEEGGQFYLVQEFIEGHDLTQEIYPDKKFSEEQAIKLLTEILEVLKYVHKENVIHRDLKPRNIMRRKSDGKIFLIDFGLVKEIKVLSLTNEGRITTTIKVGTPGYMPSEQAIGKPTICSDIYAVGITIIEALTGIQVFQLVYDSKGEIIWNNQVNVSKKFARILDKMVLYDWRDRYQTVDAVMDELRNIDKPLPLPKKTVGIVSGIFALVVVALGIVDNIFPRVIVAGPGKDVEAMYGRLETFATKGKWRKADRQNWELIKQIGDKDWDSSLSEEEVNNFSCDKLNRINAIWKERSKDKFGYTAQLQVIKEKEYTLEQVRTDSRFQGQFEIAVGWRTEDDKSLLYNDLNFTIDAPKGHLSTEPGRENFYSILTRADRCNSLSQ